MAQVTKDWRGARAVWLHDMPMLIAKDKYTAEENASPSNDAPSYVPSVNATKFIEGVLQHIGLKIKTLSVEDIGIVRRHPWYCADLQTDWVSVQTLNGSTINIRVQLQVEEAGTGEMVSVVDEFTYHGAYTVQWEPRE